MLLVTQRTAADNVVAGKEHTSLRWNVMSRCLLRQFVTYFVGLLPLLKTLTQRMKERLTFFSVAP